MSSIRKFSALLFMASLLTASTSFANDPTQYPTGYIPSPIDRSALDEDPPILRSSGSDSPPILGDETLPVSYDMREHNRVPSPRNQGHWGTCWAHAAIGSIETAYLTLFPSEDINLSEMHLAYFVYGDKRPGKSFGLPHDDEGILAQGGNADQSVAFLSKLGTVSESVLPYSNTHPDRLPENYKPAGIRLKAAYTLPSPMKDPDTTKRFILETGGVQISYYSVETAYYKGESGKTAFYDDSHGTSTNHAVLIIGWDDNFSRENFPESKRPENNGAWLVRNSWGSSWSNGSGNVGENGCFWMSYEQHVQNAAVFMPAKSSKGLRHYGYDDLGHCSSAYSSFLANVFRAEGNESLVYVGFQTRANNTSYDIYIYDLGTESSDSPANGTLIASFTDGYAPYEGYYTVDVSGKISAGHYFSVVMKTNKGLAAEGSLEWGNGNAYSNPVCNPGESYGSSDGESWRERDTNVCIKAFTVPDADDPDLKRVEISPANFPDEVFRDYLNDFDFDENGCFSARELKAVTSITLNQSGLRSLKGIELLPHVISLDISENFLNAIDLSANTELSHLVCSSQDSAGLVLTKTGDDLYSVNLKDYISGDISRVVPESVKVSSGDVNYDSSSGVTQFTYMASSVRYDYKTGFGDTVMSVSAHTRYDGGTLVNIDSANFPDNNFRAFVARYDTDKDGWLSTEELGSVTKLTVYGSKVASLKGIENFTALKELDFSTHNVTAIDVSRNTELTKLDCSGNKLSALDVSSNTKLIKLYCGANKISSLNINSNIELEVLSCYRNQLSVLDVSRNTKLTDLSCYDNSIAALDLSANTELDTLYCGGNKLSALNVSKNTKLTELSCRENSIAALSLSANTELTELYCSSNQLTALDLSRNTKLTYLSCYDNSIAALDLSANTELAELYCYSNQLTALDLSANTKLKSSYIEHDGQKRGGLNVASSDGKYSVSLSDYVSDISRVKADSVKDTAKSSCTYDSENGIATFTAHPGGLRYEYDTGCVQEDSRYMDVTIMADTVSAQAPVITTAQNLGRVSVNDNASIQLEATGEKPITWTKTGGTFPEGLSFSNSGKISGIPSAEGSYSFTVKAENSGGYDTRTFTLEVFRPYITVTRATLPEATDGSSYSFTFTAEGHDVADFNADNVAWTFTGDFPEGITHSDDGKISGVPEQTGSFTFTATASLDGLTDSADFTLTVNPAFPSITTEALPNAALGESYSFTLQASGTMPITWTVDGLPSRLEVDSETGEISGTPLEDGTFEVSITARNSAGDDTATMTLTVVDMGIRIDAENFPDIALRDYVSKNFDGNGNGWLDDEEIVSADEIVFAEGECDVSRSDASMKGIEFFTELREIDCRNFSNRLDAIDTSRNTKLVSLHCPAVKSLDVTANTALVSLTFSAAEGLRTVNLSKNKALRYLDCSSGCLEALDVTGNTSLVSLDCSGNRLPRLDLSGMSIRSAILGGQTVTPLKASLTLNAYIVRLSDYLSSSDLSKVSATGQSYDQSAHTMEFTTRPEEVSYDYDTGAGSMTVTITQGNEPEIIGQGLPETFAGGEYSAELDAFGVRPLSWDIVGGKLPDGLSMDVAGKISGVAAETGLLAFTVRAENSFGSDTEVFSLTVKPSELPAINSDTELPQGFANFPYSYALGVSGIPAPSVRASGLPHGLSVSETGTISGVPAKSGKYTVTVTATNAAGSSEKVVSLTVSPAKKLKITPNTIPNTKCGKKYSKAFKLSGLKSASWTISGDLPSGLTFDAEKAKISGTPNETGTFTITITAGNGGVSVSQVYTFTVKGIAPKLKGSLKAGKSGLAYRSVLKATGTTPITWHVSGLLEGLSWDTNADGTECVISGTPTEIYKGKITITLANSGGTLTKSLPLKIACVKPTILTKNLPEGRQNEPYPALTLQASGSPTITWTAQKLPQGMSITEDGKLSGTPSVYGNFRVKFTAKNLGGSKSKTLTLKVARSEARTAMTESISRWSTGYSYAIIAELPVISVDESGMYEFAVSADENVPAGTLLWRENPDSEDDKDNAIFLDDDGEITDVIPETGSFTVSAWLEPGKVYCPVILVRY